MMPKKAWNVRVTLNWLVKNPSLVFVILSVFFGLFFIFKLAPLNGTDEFTHFPRVYQITDGTFWERKLPGNLYGGYLPSNVNTMINDYRNLSRGSTGPQYQSDKTTLYKKYNSISQVGHNKVAAIFTSVVFYPPWAYIPSILGVLFAKAISVPLLWYVYLGRIFSLLAWIGLTWLAIRYVPRGKWFLVALALLPTSITQAATIGSDGILNATSWLIIALTLAILSKSTVLTWKKLLALSTLSIYLCVIKDGYWLIALFPLIIPLEYVQNKVLGRAWKSLTLVAMVAAGGLFALRTKHVVSNVLLTPIQGMNINTKMQLHYMLHHPLLFTLRALGQPFTKSFDTIYLGIFGVMTNRLIYLSILVIALLAVGLYIGLSATQNVPNLMNNRKKLWIVAAVILVGTYFLIAVSFYVGETGVGSSIINSIYGRYFLPLFPILLIFPMTIRRAYIPNNTRAITTLLAISFIGLAATSMIIGS